MVQNTDKREKPMRKSRKTTLYTRRKSSPFLPIAAVLCILLAAAKLFFAENSSENIAFFSARKSAAARPAEQRTISILHDGDLIELGLEDYLVGVTAAEMPANYDIEALKAQAVAARTYTLRKLNHNGCSKNDSADICTDSGHCQAYAADERLQSRWKKKYDENLSKIKEAVYSTAGEIITYRGEAIDAMYHASAGGATENSEDVYKNEIAYLRGVESPDSAGYEKTVTYTFAEFADRINRKLGTSLRTETLPEEIEVLSRYPSGRVAKIRAGDKTISGNKFRGAAGLPSAMFTYELADETIVFSVKGYGHGVGMSQSGANHYAEQGMDYRDILHHYYTDVSIEKVDA